MSYILSTEAAEDLSPSSPVIHRSPTTSKSVATIRTLDQGSKQILNQPEYRLLASILLSVYQDIVHTGPSGRTFKELTDEDMADLEDIADHLGMPQGSVEKLVAAGLAKHAQSKLDRKRERSKLGEVTSVSYRESLATEVSNVSR
jgi:hypothetical protein